MREKELCEKWIEAKEKEKEATEARRAIEEEMIELLGEPDGKESQTHKFEFGTVTVKTGTSVKVDWDKLLEIDSLVYQAISKPSLNRKKLNEISRMTRWCTELFRLL